jgi:selenocysteine-specific elongation factor
VGSTNFIIATAGHVDHGKSSLVKALTNTDPDRLPEEKRRGITIDLGFAHLQLPDPRNPDDHLEIGIIDVPGHEDFVKNMVTGVGAIDAALIVIAADDGWMPQTEEHLQILTYLRVRQAVVVLTKADLPEAEPELVEQIIRDELADTLFAPAPIVRTSVVDGRGLEDLKSALGELLGNRPSPPKSGKPRLCVDRAFTLHGIGTVATGTVEGGALTTGQNVLIQPRGTAARIRTLQTFGTAVDSAGPGTRAAINLPDIDAAENTGKPFVMRGDVITSTGEADTVLNTVIEKSARPISPHSPANKPLKHGTRLRIHIGTANAVARLQLAETKELLPGASALAQLRFESPVYAREGDRFTIRDWPESATLAGGQVLELRCDQKEFRKPARQAFLQARAQAENRLSPWIESLLKRDGAAVATDLLKQSVFSEGEIELAVSALIEGGSAVRQADFLVSTEWWQARQNAALQTVKGWQESHPDLPGHPLPEFRQALNRQMPESLIKVLLDELCQQDLRVSGTFISTRSHQPRLPGHLQSPCAEIRSRLLAKPNEPPGRAMLAPTPEHEQALSFLIVTGEVIELDQETVLSAAAAAEMKSQITAHLATHGESTTSELRQLMNTSRRIAMPLLERFDQEGITQRRGDTRILGTTA